MTLGLNAQAFTIDTTFQPFFDIRSFNYVGIDRIHEIPSGKLFLSGAFAIRVGAQTFGGLVSVLNDGSRNVNFNNGAGGSAIVPISPHYFAAGSSLYNKIDTNGNLPFPNWLNTYNYTVPCTAALPYFYEDGSALFQNNNSGVPCKVYGQSNPNPGTSSLIKVTPQGYWDSTFTGRAYGEVDFIFDYDTSRLMLMGRNNRFKTYNGDTINNLCRIFHDGSLDTTFSSPLKDTTFISAVNTSEAEEDGSFLLYGAFALKGYNQLFSLVKLKADGSLDSTFNNFNTVVHQYHMGFLLTGINKVLKTDDGGYLVGGNFSTYQGYQKNDLVKLDSNGNVEPQYFTSPGPDSSQFAGTLLSTVHTITRSRFGGYYVGGSFLKWDGKAVQPIVRIFDENYVTGANSLKPKAKSLKLYPNPTKGIVNVQTDQAIESIRVFDINGRLLVRLSGVKITSKRTQFELPQEKGLYLVRIVTEDGQLFTEKIVKQ